MITSDVCLLMERNRKLRDLHEEAVKKSNAHYINELKLRLNDKDIKILKMINMNKIVTTSQIAKIFYPDSNSPDKSTLKTMKKLFSLGCVDRFSPRLSIGEGSSEYHYVLTRPGSKLLDIKLFRPIKKLNQKWRHTVAVSEVFSGLASKYEVLDWKQEIKLKYSVGSKEYEIRPDCFSYWLNNENDNYAFFEIDLSTENQDVLNKKIDAYHNYFFNSSDFKCHDWQPFEAPVTIPIIFILNDRKRLSKLNNYYSKFIDKHSSDLKCHFTTFENLI
ncbi:replication initiation by nicking [Bacillus phage G]|uniref:Gp146 n=1 Tax=Bacillus phage G TaxID=2884420 RepID=G3MBL2_9CAUD|nr:replication initiation by nicking [Bacillus phage G]AEO93408.1 gp146 [Bacillus phage G]